MRTKRFTITAFLLCAVMLLGVGFAALTDMLTINGTINTNQPAARDAFDELVHFSAADAAANVDEATVVESGNSLENMDKVSLRVNSIGVAGQSAVFTLTIENESENYDAKIKVHAIVFDEFFTVQCVRTDDSAINSDNDENPLICSAGGTVDIKVIVTINKTFEEAHSATFTIDLEATSQPKASQA